MQLVSDDEALKEIEKTAATNKTGARGLLTTLEDVMLDIMYGIPNIKENIPQCMIAKDNINIKSPVIIKKVKREKAAVTTTL